MISVILPNYNHAQFLEVRINSILAQTFKDFEIIILDDASTDSSKDVIEQFRKESRISFIEYNLSNSGSPFMQWAKGIELAKGDLIWIAESDDLADPNFLEKVSQPLFEDSSIVLSYCQSKKIDSQGRHIGDMQYWTNGFNSDRWNMSFVNNGVDEQLNYLYYTNTIPNASAVVFRKKAFMDLFPLSYPYKVIGDWQIWFKLIGQGKIAFTNEKLNCFRFHSESVRESKVLLLNKEIKRFKRECIDYLLSSNLELTEKVLFHFFDTIIKAEESYIKKLSAIADVLKMNQIIRMSLLKYLRKSYL